MLIAFTKIENRTNSILPNGSTRCTGSAHNDAGMTINSMNSNEYFRK